MGRVCVGRSIYWMLVLLNACIMSMCVSVCVVSRWASVVSMQVSRYQHTDSLEIAGHFKDVRGHSHCRRHSLTLPLLFSLFLPRFFILCGCLGDLYSLSAYCILYRSRRNIHVLHIDQLHKSSHFSLFLMSSFSSHSHIYNHFLFIAFKSRHF